jgi:cytochrome P450
MNADETATDALPVITLPSGDTMRAASRYADVRQVLSDPRFTRELHRAPGARMVRGADISDDTDSLLNMDPPRHTRLRRIVAAAFAPRQVAAWRPRVIEITDGLVEEMSAAGGPADLVTAFAFPLPIRVICELLGVPHEDRGRFRRWSEAALTTSTADASQRAAAGAEFRAYVAGLLADRRADPGDALIDALLAARETDDGEDPDGLTDGELVSLTINLITAGHETTSGLIGSGVFTLLAEGHYAALADRPREAADTVAALVEEILRHDTPAQYGLPRLATEDVELPSGTIHRGETVLPLLAAANRDPAVYPDPDRFAPSRADAPHLTFGHGPHFCLGANLARLEVETALTALITRLPTLRLAVPPADVPWRTGGLVGGPQRLPVHW